MDANHSTELVEMPVSLPRKHGKWSTIILTIIGLIGSILSLVSGSDIGLSKRANAGIALAGGVVGLIGNAFSSLTGYLTDTSGPGSGGTAN